MKKREWALVVANKVYFIDALDIGYAKSKANKIIENLQDDEKCAEYKLFNIVNQYFGEHCTNNYRTGVLCYNKSVSKKWFYK